MKVLVAVASRHAATAEIAEFIGAELRASLGEVDATAQVDVRGIGTIADLDDYERRRRPLNIEYVQQQTIANKRRLEERDPAKRAERFAELRAMAQDAKKHAAFLMRASLLETWKA